MCELEEDYLIIVDILDDVLGEQRLHNEHKHQVAYDCPTCSYEINGLDRPDGKGNLEVNYRLGVFKCWSCGESHNTHGTIYNLIKKFGTPKQLKQYVLLKPDKILEYERKYDKVELPKEFIPFSDASLGLKMTPHYKRALNYLRRRNVSDFLIKKHNIGFCYMGKYESRIIIPSFTEDGDINYFIARSYIPYTKMKYLNPEAQKEIIIFNEHLINWNETIYLVEGAFDSIFLPNAIPMLGKKMSDYLFNKLYERAKEIVIILDGDAWEDTVKLYHILNCGRLMGKIKVVKLPMDKDIADLRGDLSNFEIKKLD